MEKGSGMQGHVYHERGRTGDVYSRTFFLKIRNDRNAKPGGYDLT